MLKRFSLSFTLVAATPKIFKLFVVGDNPDYFDKDGSAPTPGAGGKDFDINALVISASTLVRVDVGLTDAAGTGWANGFTIEIGAGQNARIDFTKMDRAKLAFTHATLNELAIRLTSVAGGATRSSGAVDIARSI